MRLPLLVGYGQFCPSSNQTGPFDHQYLLKKSSDLIFLHRDSHQGNVAPEITTFWLGLVCCMSHPVRLKDSLIGNKARKNQFISLSFSMKTAILNWVWLDVPLDQRDLFISLHFLPNVVGPI